MASRIRTQIAKQLADAVQNVSGSSILNLGKLSWCVRCAVAPRKNGGRSQQLESDEARTHQAAAPARKFIVTYKNLQTCQVIPPELPRQQHESWAKKVANNLKCLDNVKNIEATENRFVIDYEHKEFTQSILDDIWTSKDSYGKESIIHDYRASDGGTLEEQPKGQTVVVEYSSPNIAKPFHAGHLRSTIIGNFIANINQALSHKAVRINYLGDWGTQFGLLGVGYQKYGSHTTTDDKDAMQHLFDVYVKINKDITESDNDEIHKAGMAFFKRMEEGDVVATSLWQYCRDSSIKEYNKVYDRLGVRFDHYEGESQYRDKARQAVDDLTDRGLVQWRGNPGVAYVDLSSADEPNLHVNILKSDGTTLYITRDIAAAIDRQERFKFDRAHYVVENGQHLHFQQLVSVLKRMDYDWAHSCADEWHMKFGRVEGMSTRRGEVVFLKDILDEAQRCMLDNMRNTETTQVMENQEAVADRLGVSAIIVQDLKQRRLKNYKFSWERALNFNGETGVSLQYAHARLCSLEKKSGAQLNPECDVRLLVEPSATALIQHLARYDECLQASFVDIQSYHLAAYLFHLRQLVNTAFLHLQVKGQQRDLAEARLFLLHCARLTLANGLKVLGVTPLKRM